MGVGKIFLAALQMLYQSVNTELLKMECTTCGEKEI
jgi:hypothetical protein